MSFPLPITLAFILVTFTTIFIFYKSTIQNKKALTIILLVLAAQGLLSLSSFYSVQPIQMFKVPIMVAPSILIIFLTLLPAKGKQFIQTLNLKTLTLLHAIRIPVELILFLLFTQKAIPEIMTFEGRNFDIIAGITSPVVYYLAFIKNKIGPQALLAWNVFCLGLLINIIVHAVLSLEIPIQQFGFDQPNRAILSFPFTWLPSVVVPIVLFAHCAAIQRLVSKQKIKR